MMDFYLRIAGASAGSRMQRLIPGDTGAASLVAAGAGSKAFRQVYSKIFKNIPESLKMDVMTEMFKDPDLLAVMLSKGKTEREKQSIAKRLYEILLNKGFTGITSTVRRGLPAFTREGAEEAKEPEVDTTPPPLIKPVLLDMLESTGTLDTSQVTPPAQIPTNQQAQAQPSSGPTDPNLRARYASLFPSDPISSMLRASKGGIVSLRGRV
jgi:hypothetical protein